MDSGLWWLLVGVAVVLAVTVLVAVLSLVSASRARRRLQDDLAATREELAAVQRRVEGLARKSPATSAPQEFVITTAGPVDAPGEVEPAAPVTHEQLTTRQFASVALGESLVTLASFGYGVRRALSPENRNRIAFEMRREVRRARKQRRRDLKEARRHLRAQSLDENAA
jgi:hypothetical protein